MYLYQGLRPHAEAASKGTPADPNRVVQDSTLGRLGHLLNAAVAHSNSGRFDAARSTYEAAEIHLHEIRAVLDTAEAAYAEVGRGLAESGPPVDLTSAEPTSSGSGEPSNPNIVGVESPEPINPNIVGVEPDPVGIDAAGIVLEPDIEPEVRPEVEAERPRGKRR